jgi:tetratricopeptide (TPR) repeat protein
MSRTSLAGSATRLALLCVCLCAAVPCASARAQAGQGIKELKRKASELIDGQRYTEALPLLEKIAAAEPEDAETQFYLGFALVAQANVSKDAGTRASLRARARTSFLKAKGLGYNKPVLDAVIRSLDPDAPKGRGFSPNAEADRLMREAESFFARGKQDEALASYQKALALDPELYEAALYCGDVYTHRGDFAQAEVWYQKAIRIDPTRETAYRYSATPLMKQKKYEEARERYVEAFINEPYNRYTAAGLSQWAQTTNTRLGHPAIDIPTSVTFDAKGNASVKLDPAALGKDDGSFAWVGYGATRTLWRREKFARTFPRETVYRHSLAEEAEALRGVVSMAAAGGKTKTLGPALSKLKRLDEEGLLEAYILLARPDDGIARDHPAYLKQNRDRLRRYVVAYVLNGGGQ